jgi:hypothetical protein
MLNKLDKKCITFHYTVMRGQQNIKFGLLCLSVPHSHEDSSRTVCHTVLSVKVVTGVAKYFCAFIPKAKGPNLRLGPRSSDTNQKTRILVIFSCGNK